MPKFLRATIAALALTPAVTAGQAAAADTPATTASPDTVVALPSAPAGVVVPSDPALNAYELAGRILGVAQGKVSGDEKTATGQELWAFGLQWTTTPANHDGTVGMTVYVTAGTTRIPVVLPARADRPGGATSGPMWFLASVPTGPGDSHGPLQRPQQREHAWGKSSTTTNLHRQPALPLDAIAHGIPGGALHLDRTHLFTVGLPLWP